jgi:hypothetical protein
MKTLTPYKINKEQFREYVASRMFNDDTQEEDERELINYVVERFKAEYLFPKNLIRYKTIQKCLEEWLKGLPSCLGIDFYNGDIINIYKAMEVGEVGFEDLLEEEQDYMLNSYWKFVSYSLNEIYLKHNEATIF